VREHPVRSAVVSIALYGIYKTGIAMNAYVPYSEISHALNSIYSYARQRLLYVARAVLDDVHTRISEFYRHNIYTPLVERYGEMYPQFRPFKQAFKTEDVEASGREVTYIFDRLCTTFSLKLNYIQMSKKDVENGRCGLTSIYWPKDVERLAPAKPAPSDVDAYIDVDYYVDMPHRLATRPKPVLLYTFVPDSVAANRPGYSYTFDEHDNIVLRTSTGAHYTHRLWNYGADTFTAYSFWRSTSYQVDKIVLEHNREAILLTPILSLKFPFNLLYRSMTSQPLDRLSVTKWIYNEKNGHIETFLRLNVARSEGMVVSTGLPGSFCCTNVPAHVDSGILSYHKVASILPQIATLESWASKATEGLIQKPDLVPLIAYARAKGCVDCSTVYPVERATRTYTYDTNTIAPIASSVTAFMTPIVHAAFCPAADQRTATQAVLKRVLAFQKRKPPKITPFIATCIHEFVQFLVPQEHVHTLSPSDVDTVYEHQAKPMQRTLIERGQAFYQKDRPVLSSFVKREAYGNVKDPRVITTMPPALKLVLSCFLYPIAELIESLHGVKGDGTGWYACGSSPRDIAARVAHICEGSEAVAKTDFHRFDGHFNQIGIELERALFTRAYHPTYHNEVLPSLQKTYNARACMAAKRQSEGFMYNTGTSVASGKPVTSLDGTIMNAFSSYYSLRRSVGPHGYHIQPQDAFNALGIYLGDDGLTSTYGNVRPAMDKRCLELGFVLELDWVPRFQPGIEFLSRKYTSEVWTGNPASSCDIIRQLSKLHVAANMPPSVTPQQKMYEKARAYLLMDPNTPILSDYCKKFVSLFEREGGVAACLPDADLSSFLVSYFARFDLENQYPNDATVDEHVKADLETVNFNFDRFYEHLHNATSTIEMLAFPICADQPEPVSKNDDVIVDDGVIGITVGADKGGVARQKNEGQTHGKDGRQQSKAKGRKLDKTVYRKPENSKSSNAKRPSDRKPSPRQPFKRKPSKAAK
jgi:hypothetical protein